MFVFGVDGGHADAAATHEREANGVGRMMSMKKTQKLWQMCAPTTVVLYSTVSQNDRGCNTSVAVGQFCTLMTLYDGLS